MYLPLKPLTKFEQQKYRFFEAGKESVRDWIWMIKIVIQNKCSCVTNKVFGSKSLRAELHDCRISQGGFFNYISESQLKRLNQGNAFIILQ